MTTTRGRWRPRHVQYVPAIDVDVLRRADAGPADGLLVDLEDGVLASMKDTARAACREFLADAGASSRCMVRVNEAGSPWADADLVAVADRATRLLVPKIHGPEDVVALSARLDELERDAGRPTGSIEVLPILETAAAVLAASDLARASERVVGLVLGQADLTVDLGCSGLGDDGFVPSPMLDHALAWTVYAAVAAGLPCYVSPWVREGDPEGRERELRRVLDLGFTGIVVYDAEGVAAVESARRPTPGQLRFAREAVEARADAAAHGRGATKHRGWTIEGSYGDIVDALLRREEEAGRDA